MTILGRLLTGFSSDKDFFVLWVKSNKYLEKTENSSVTTNNIPEHKSYSSLHSLLNWYGIYQDFYKKMIFPFLLKNNRRTEKQSEESKALDVPNRDATDGILLATKCNLKSSIVPSQFQRIRVKVSSLNC